MSEIGKECLKNSNKVFEEFGFYHRICERLREVFYQDRAPFLSDVALTPDDFEFAANNEPARLARDVSNKIGSMVRPHGKEWFKMVVGDPEEDPPVVSHEGRIWLEETTKRMRRMIYIPRAHFSPQMALDDKDYVVFGSSVSSVLVNRKQDGLVFTNKHLRSCAWQEDEEHNVNCMDEKMMPTAKMMKERFGETKLHKDVKDALDTGKATYDPLKRFPVRRIVMPAEQWSFSRNKQGALPPLEAAYAVIYVCETSMEVMFEEWKTYFPFHVRQWSKAGARPWGTSMITPLALGDSRLLSTADRGICESIQKMVDPPLLAKHEAIVGPSVDLQAGGITYGMKDYDYRQGRPIEVAHEVGNPSYGMEYMKQKYDVLRAVFFESIFSLPTEHEMTLGEVQQRLEEIIQRVAPIFEPMESDSARMLDKVFYIGQDYRAFEVPPDDIGDRETRYDFDTPVQSTLAKLRVMEARQTGAYVLEMEGADPHVKKYVRWNKVHRAALAGLGPIAWQNDPDDVAAQIEAEEGEARQSRALAMAAEIAKTGPAKSITDKALSEAPPGAAGQMVQGMVNGATPPAAPPQGASQYVN